jgi:hypothetical protein
MQPHLHIRWLLASSLTTEMMSRPPCNVLGKPHLAPSSALYPLLSALWPPSSLSSLPSAFWPPPSAPCPLLSGSAVTMPPLPQPSYNYYQPLGKYRSVTRSVTTHKCGSMTRSFILSRGLNTSAPRLPLPLPYSLYATHLPPTLSSRTVGLITSRANSQRHAHGFPVTTCTPCLARNSVPRRALSQQANRKTTSSTLPPTLVQVLLLHCWYTIVAQLSHYCYTIITLFLHYC